METLETCKQQAMLALQNNHLLDADQWLHKALERSDTDLDILRMSAQVSGQLGRFEDTARFCEQVLALNPADAMAWAFLGNARMAGGEYEKALEALNKALGLAPNAPMILINRGGALFLLNRHDEAIACLNRALQLAPGTALAHFNLGRIYKTLGDFGQATSQFELAIRHDPDLADAYINLSGILFAMGRLDDAERVALDAIRTHPEIHNFRNSLVNLYRFRGEYDRALEECETILRHAPGNAAAMGSKANLLEHKGEYEQAYALVRELVETNQLDAGNTEVYAHLCHRFDACEDAIRYISALLEREALDENKRTLHFSLGHIFNRLGRYEEAFEHYTTANRLSSVKYDIGGTLDNFRRIAATFSSAHLATLPRSGNDSDRPVFVVGMPRSGTSLVEQILSSHAEIFGAGELDNLNQVVASLRSRTGNREDYPECAARLEAGQLNELADEYLAHLERLTTKARRVVDKMPHNFRHLGLICRLFPGARIIHCVRDPRDTCLSIFFQSFNQTHAYGANLETLARYYRAYEELMQHWRSVVDIPFYEIHYADLVADQEKYSRELIEFCGLDWDERCLDFHTAKRDVATASYDQVRRPMYKSSLERWRRYEPYIQPLIEALENPTQ